MTTHPRLLLAVQTILLVAILAVCVALAARHPVRWDLTPEHRFTLSPHTRAVLDRLATPATITAFYSNEDNAIRRGMADLLALYRDASPRLTVTLLDLDRSPGAAQRLGVSSYNVAVVEATRHGASRREQVEIVNEDTLTAAIARAAGAPIVPTYWIVGHGERDPMEPEDRGGAAAAARALGLDGFAVRPLTGAARIPSDAGLVVLAGPTRDLGDGEVDALAAWVAGGGRLLVLTDPGTPPSVRRLLARVGIEPGDDVVVDAGARLFGTDALSARIAYLNQAIVPQVPTVAAMLPVAQTLRLVDVPGVAADYLAVTGEDTWADVGRRALAGGDVTFREGVDRHGPLPVAALARVTRADGGDEGRAVVVGDADFVTNLHLPVLGNRDFLAIVAQVAAHAEPEPAARPRTPPQGGFSSMALTAREARLVFWTAVAGPATLLALAALAVGRRSRRA